MPSKSKTSQKLSKPRSSLRVKSKQAEPLPTFGGRTPVKGRKR